MATTICRYCGKAIGYDTRFVVDEAVPYQQAVAENKYVHADCFEDEIDRARQAN